PSRPPIPRRRVTSDPVLPERLPTSSFIQREADQLAPRSVLRQLRRSPSPPQSPDMLVSDHSSEDEETTDEPEEPPERRRTMSFSSIRSNTSLKAVTKFFQAGKPPGGAGWREPQPFEVLRAVERQDIMFLMEIRDRAFPLLLHKSGDTTPLLHAIRIGKSHREVQIILIGAFSRWKSLYPKTKMLMKRLRLAREQTDLISFFPSSYYYVLKAIAGKVQTQINNSALALRTGAEDKPVQSAESAIRKFATRELGKASMIASLEDYIANATTDLLLMGALSLVHEVIPGDPIPAWYFARDDRVYKAFLEAIQPITADIRSKCGKRLKWQLRVLQNVMEGRSTSLRTKVTLLAGELDNTDVI
ncbi:hypothetical protein DL96DRAFT_1594520, partial [Flagelloscypha sp. PMI_526]